MPVVEDTLWKNPGHPGMIVINCHGELEPDGRLYMGYGEARQALQRIPDIDLQAGEIVRSASPDGVYGFLPVRPARPDQRLVGFGLFQTRLGWNEPSNLELIQLSMNRLRDFAEDNHQVKIRMNFPGLTDGLTADEVAPVLLPLPPTVTICHQGELQRNAPGTFPGFKALYLEVEALLLSNRYNQAVEFLVTSGYDIQSAMEQVNAVQRLLRHRTDRQAEQLSFFYRGSSQT